MADQSPSSNDIQLIFKRLRSLGPNKVCFDCNAKNPTWASVTYGVFICIDCSAVHRSLGVHLTFVRSTQLDTNWTWLQIRQMQLGGNGNAQTFFQQHNCTTKDAQQKYNSRAAQLYKEKLHNLAIQAIRTHGTKLHIESHDASHGDHEAKEVDFFEEHQTSGTSNANDGEVWAEASNGAASAQPGAATGPQPSVDAILTNVATLSADADRKSTITQRKPVAKKTGLGAKKGGLGAQRVKTNFADIEQKAAQADKDRERAEEEAKIRAEKTAEEEQKQLASMRLAYQDLSQLKKKEEDKLRNVDPKKAQQLERLGMGFASKSGVSHSVMTDMQVIEQDAPAKSSTINLGRSLYDRDDFNRDSLFDDRDDLSCTSHRLCDDRRLKDMMKMLMDSNVNDDSPSSSSKTGWESTKLNWDNKSEWESSPSPPKAMSLSSSSSSRSNKAPSKPESSRSASRDSGSKGSSATSPASPTTAQQKFGSAKAISSDQYFSDSADQTWERKANLSRFEGSSSISSADFFNGDSSRNSGGSGGGGYSGQFVAPDLEDVKESVRQGVTKVAGKLSSLANGVVSTIQERYGNY